MTEPRASNDESCAEILGLDSFRQPLEEGLSLDKLNRAFASMLGTGEDPYSVPRDPDDDPIRTAIAVEVREAAGSRDRSAGDTACEINPRTILEAMMFVGTPGNQSLAAQQIAGLMRGVRPTEIDELVKELNEAYAGDRRPYRIASQGAGYRLVLREEFEPIRDRLQGRIKEARLSPAAIEVLAVIAYNEPLSADEVNHLRGTSSGPILAQLVRRRLVRIERPDEGPRAPRYLTTERFLKLFGIQGLAELPRSLDLDRQ
ncbi:MAG TPA: SMC-Scp complex subunit ScpB [Pirellulales bacterium]|nr:SMC-Scp complex subunit ScpB [Pirellulales bacterium]